MPRPGPRPYECVRRAWHSDRHQPIRGSIIRQIFRVVTEAHSSSIRKNREWQEKLPRVVLRAEEIIYSKANSEAEYMDCDTLWERLNDAVDTIIRKDENETGQFLQPCIEGTLLNSWIQFTCQQQLPESQVLDVLPHPGVATTMDGAALVLGCIPIRASRSQRHSNPRSYLNSRFEEPAQMAPVVIPDKTLYHRPPPQTPTPSGDPLSISRSPNAIPLSNKHIVPHLRPNLHQPMPSSIVLESSNSLQYGSAYPLYYGCHFKNIEPQFGFGYLPQNSHPNNIIVGTPVGWPAPHFPSTRNLLSKEKFEEVNRVEFHGKGVEKDCDLSLRLGPSDGDSSSQQETSKNHEFSFFPEPSKSCNEKHKQEGEVQDRNVNSRKRKASEDRNSEDECIQWLPQLNPNQFSGQVRWRGL